MSNGTGVPDNPMYYEAEDYQGRKITISIPWNATTRALQDVTVTRDAACLYTHIYIGLGADGSPNSTQKAFTIRAGTTVVKASQIAKQGLSTVDDVSGIQITAGP